MTTRLVFGHGINDIKGQSQTGAYIAWKGMLKRCYCPSTHKRSPTYLGCSVCDEWLVFSNFKKWYEKHYKKGFQLDKDLIFKDNKVYSPYRCMYVPSKLNNLILSSAALRGDLPQGVSKHGNGYKSTVSINGRSVHKKTRKTVVEALIDYSNMKYAACKEYTLEAVNNGFISICNANAIRATQREILLQNIHQVQPDYCSPSVAACVGSGTESFDYGVVI